jgi:hypothetical protein
MDITWGWMDIHAGKKVFKLNKGGIPVLFFELSEGPYFES